MLMCYGSFASFGKMRSKGQRSRSQRAQMWSNSGGIHGGSCRVCLVFCFCEDLLDVQFLFKLNTVVIAYDVMW